MAKLQSLHLAATVGIVVEHLPHCPKVNGSKLGETLAKKEIYKYVKSMSLYGIILLQSQALNWVWHIGRTLVASSQGQWFD